MSDLSSPLGLKAPGADGKRLPIGLVVALAAVVLASVVGLWILVVDDPLGGQPVVVSTIQDSSGTTDRSDVTVVGVKSSNGEILPPVAAGEEEPTVDVAAPVEGDPVGPSPDMPIAARDDLQEEGPYGPLPRVADDGSRPLDVYARPVPGFVGASPKIAIVVGGLGLSQTGTQEALKQLPAEVTLAFAPYGSSLDRWARQARQDGHEILLQLPLEPFDYPDNDPGPHTLLTTASPDKNLDRLHWLMARISTYVGVMTYMGARFTADAAALDPLMGDLAARGLMFVDDGTSSRSIADQASRARTTPFARADLVVDAIASRQDVVGRLAQLEQIARARGLAVGVASALPMSVREIGAWAKTLEDRGITLVPISAAQRKLDVAGASQ